MKSARWVLIMITVVLAVAACGRGTGGEEAAENGDGESGATWEGAAEAGPDGPLAVEAVEATRAALVSDITASGVIRGVSEARVVSETQGIIRDVRFELGEEVTAGEVLVALDSEIERLQMEQARRQLETARLELRATEQLAERGSTSQAELARVRANAAGAEAAYEQAKKRFEDKTITAPISGRVAARSENVTPGNYLNPGVEVARIVDLRELEMEIAVGEREVGYLAPGTPVSVSIPACPDLEAQQARVASVAAGSDAATGSFPAIIRWENTCGDEVRSGMSASARIEPQGVEEVLVVPTQAIGRDSEGAFVFLAAEGGARRARVETGRRLGSRTEITAGLSAGDIVITTATSRLRDGDAVEVTVNDMSGEAL